MWSSIGEAVLAIFAFMLLRELVKFLERLELSSRERVVIQKEILSRLISLDDQVKRERLRQIALSLGQPDPEGKRLLDLENAMQQHSPGFTEEDLLREYGTTEVYDERLNEKNRRREFQESLQQTTSSS